MDTDPSDEIVRGFLVAAGQILDQLHGQLARLADAPGDEALLDGVQRALQTLRGAAGPVRAAPVAEVCALAEDALDSLRRSGGRADPALTEVLLRVRDSVAGMLANVSAGAAAKPAPAWLTSALQRLAACPPGPLPAPPTRRAAVHPYRSPGAP